jgi:hypothetical protein
MKEAQCNKHQPPFNITSNNGWNVDSKLTNVTFTKSDSCIYHTVLCQPRSHGKICKIIQTLHCERYSAILRVFNQVVKFLHNNSHQIIDSKLTNVTFTKIKMWIQEISLLWNKFGHIQSNFHCHLELTVTRCKRSI